MADPIEQLVAMAEQLEEAKAELAAARKVMDRPIKVTVASSSDQDATLRKIEVRQTEVVGQMMQALEVQQQIKSNMQTVASALNRIAKVLERAFPEEEKDG